MDLSKWSDADLDRLIVSAKDHDPEVIPAPEPGERREASTVFIAGPLMMQVLGYQRSLARTFDHGITQLSNLAGDEIHNRPGGNARGDVRGDVIIAAMTTGFISAAVQRFRHSFDTGQRFAVSFLGKSALTNAQVDDLVTEQIGLNEGFVRDSLMADVRTQYRGAIRDSSLTPAATAAAVAGLSDSMGARVGMYALRLWGVGHLGFGSEMQASGKLLDWVLTSDAPCKDCPRLARGGPYGGDRPLPTFPGTGDTECRTNCLCLLREHAGASRPPVTEAAPAAQPSPSTSTLLTSLFSLFKDAGEAQTKKIEALIEAVKNMKIEPVFNVPEVPPAAITVEPSVVHVETPVTVSPTPVEIRTPEQRPAEVRVEVPEPRRRKTKVTPVRDKHGLVDHYIKEEL